MTEKSRVEIRTVDWIKKPVMLIPTQDYENIMSQLLKGQSIGFNIKTKYNSDNDSELLLFKGEIKEYTGELDELIRR